jgi:hypothetical protein
MHACSHPLGTTIKHPYLLQISGRDEDYEDDTYMGYHYTTCPDCEREIPNEPTKKEFAEMMRYYNHNKLYFEQPHKY